MRAYDYLVKCPSFPLIKRKFPDFTEFSKSIEVIPWEDEYAIANRNPEVIDYLEFLEKMLQMQATPAGRVSQQSQTKKGGGGHGLASEGCP